MAVADFFLYLPESRLAMAFQSVCAAIIVMARGMIMLRYRTMAPKLFTLKPMANNNEIEKKVQK